MAKTKQQWMVEDRLWEQLQPLIPARPVPRGPGGRPRIDDQAALAGILSVLDTGCRWRDLPEELGCGSGHTAWRRLREWQDAVIWDRLHQLVRDELSQAELLDWSRGCIDGVSVRSKKGGRADEPDDQCWFCDDTRLGYHGRGGPGDQDVGVAYNFLAVEHEQLYLLPPSVKDWLPEDHLAFFVHDAVEEIDLSAFYADYRADGWGGAAHDPKLMVALLLYGYCVGIRSSRQIERACHVDVAFRVLAANQAPDHTTINRFRGRHEQALKTLFTASLRLCARAGMTTVGLVAVDGTKMAAAAAMAANRTQATIEAEVEKMFAKAKALDEAGDAEYGPESGPRPPAALRGRADRRRRFAQAKQQLDDELAAERAAHETHLAARAATEAQRGKKLRGRKPKPPGEKAGHKERRVNTSDPDSRIMATKQRFVQGYNAQAVANTEQVIVAATVTDEHNDTSQLPPMIAATFGSLAAAGITERPAILLADAGYASESNFAQLDGTDPNAYVATRNMRNNPTPRTGKRGPLRAGATLVERMDRKVSNKAGRALYRRRQGIIEPVFGQIKEARGIRRFARRGRAAVESEWQLIAGTHNLLKLYRRALTDTAVAPYSRLATTATG